MRRFADCGYAAASVQEIVDAAAVTKPTLYYYFPSKARLYAALVEQAHDERYRLMREAAEAGGNVARRLEAILTAVFAFARKNQDLMRLAFATAFAAPGEVPRQVRRLSRARRNFNLVRTLVAEGQASGELNPAFDRDALALGIYGQLTTHIMVQLFRPQARLDRPAARRIVRLFLEGARPRPTDGTRLSS